MDLSSEFARSLQRYRRPLRREFQEVLQQADINSSRSAFPSHQPHESALPLSQQSPFSTEFPTESDAFSYHPEDSFVQRDDTGLESYDSALLSEPSRVQEWQMPNQRTRLSLPSRATSTQRPLTALHSFNFERTYPQQPRTVLPKHQGSHTISELSPPATLASSSPPSTGSSPSFQVNQRRKAKDQKRTKSAVITTTQKIRNPDPTPSITALEPILHGSDKPPTVQSIQLVSPQALPDRFRSIFPFKLFNAVQSSCFDDVYLSNDNIVLSAPTGSGKTVVLELAICQLMAAHTSDKCTIIYMAPTKSLCSERCEDWEKRFKALGLSCAELTGDTDASELFNVQRARIIITTPEKWDSTTRKWKDRKRLIQLVKLFLIDEVHILKETRGATLEAVVSRMKSVGTDIRFIALSATIPNSEDIAKWLGKSSAVQHVPAVHKVFGEKFRPVLLQKYVYGIPHRGSDWSFDNICRKKLPDIIAKYSAGKPVMIFCCTRKSAIETAKALTETWKSSRRPENQAHGRGVFSVQDPSLRETVAHGVAFHHAGLDYSDRSAVKRGFEERHIDVICCTSTLAVGVNLPCHLVIIQNTVTWQDTGLKEYSDLEITQMLGRAGRPQFDNSAIAVIITKEEKVKKYEGIAAGEEVLESCLHLNLIDHLNAEISLGTIQNIQSAKNWLAGTFLYVRLAQNPAHYKLGGDLADGRVDGRIEEICNRDIRLLQEADLLYHSDYLRCTDYGNAMAQYCVKFQTMCTFLNLPPMAKISEILSVLSGAEEFNEVRFRTEEKALFKTLNSADGIKFPIQGDITSAAHKRSIMIQSELGGVEFPNSEQFANLRRRFEQERRMVFSNIHRLIRCITECQLHSEDAVAARNSLELSRSLGAKVWDDSPLQMKQIQGIGPVTIRKLASANITNLEALEATEPGRINLLLSKQNGFGYSLQQKLSEFPKLRISVKITSQVIKIDEPPLVKFKAELGFVNDKLPRLFNKKPVYVCCLAERSDGLLLGFKRISASFVGKEDLYFSAQLLSESHRITCYAMCDEIAGTLRFAELTPKLPSSSFPRILMQSSYKNARGSIGSATMSSLPHPLSQFPSASEALDRDLEERAFDDLEDSDLMAAADQIEFPILEEIESGPVQLQASFDLNAHAPKEHENRDRLENGNWACSHKCKDKTACKHLCCREGVDRPRRRSKAINEPKEQKQTKSRAEVFRSHDFDDAIITRPSSDCHAASFPNSLVERDRSTSKRTLPIANQRRRQSPVDLDDDNWMSDLPSLSPLLAVKPNSPDNEENKRRIDSHAEDLPDCWNSSLSGNLANENQEKNVAGSTLTLAQDSAATANDMPDDSFFFDEFLTDPASSIPDKYADHKMSLPDEKDNHVCATPRVENRTATTTALTSAFFPKPIRMPSKRALSEISESLLQSVKYPRMEHKKDNCSQEPCDTQAAQTVQTSPISTFRPFKNMEGIDLNLIDDFKDFVDFVE